MQEIIIVIVVLLCIVAVAYLAYSDIVSVRVDGKKIQEQIPNVTVEADLCKVCAERCGFNQVK